MRPRSASRRRGVLLAFPRKIVEHPALSAAAMFVLVGGAVAINWSHGKLTMPAAEHADVEAPKGAEAPKPTEATEPAAGAKLPAGAPAVAAAEPLPAPKTKEADSATATGLFKGEAANKPAAPQEDSTPIALETPSGTYGVRRAAAHRPAVAVATPAPAKAAPARMKNIASDGKLGKYDSSLDDRFAGKDEAAGPNGVGSVTRGGSGGAVGGVLGVTGGGGRAAANEGAKSSAPDELSGNTVAEKAATGATTPSHGYAGDKTATGKPTPAASSSQHSWQLSEAATPPAAPPPPPATARAPATARDQDYLLRSQAQPAPAVQKPAANARNFDVVRKQADEYAKTGRCEEAIKLFQELDRANQHLSPGERVGWVRCLTRARPPGRGAAAARRAQAGEEGHQRADPGRRARARRLQAARRGPGPGEEG